VNNSTDHQGNEHLEEKWQKPRCTPLKSCPYIGLFLECILQELIKQYPHAAPAAPAAAVAAAAAKSAAAATVFVVSKLCVRETILFRSVRPRRGRWSKDRDQGAKCG
jgi:hypothetical protein